MKRLLLSVASVALLYSSCGFARLQDAYATCKKEYVEKGKKDSLEKYIASLGSEKVKEQARLSLREERKKFLEKVREISPVVDLGVPVSGPSNSVNPINLKPVQPPVQPPVNNQDNTDTDTDSIDVNISDSNNSNILSNLYSRFTGLFGSSKPADKPADKPAEGANIQNNDQQDGDADKQQSRFGVKSLVAGGVLGTAAFVVGGIYLHKSGKAAQVARWAQPYVNSAIEKCGDAYEGAKDMGTDALNWTKSKLGGSDAK